MFNEENEALEPIAGNVPLEIPRGLHRSRRRNRSRSQTPDPRGTRRNRSRSGTPDSLFSQPLEPDSDSDSEALLGDGRRMTQQDVVKIERTLTKLSAHVMKGWNERQVQTELEKAASAAFSEVFDWGPDQDMVEQYGEQAQVDVVLHMDRLVRLLNDVVAQLPPDQSTRFEATTGFVDGYMR